MEQQKKAYVVGGGLAGLAAAVYLAADAGMKGSDITIFDSAAESGGSMDGHGTAETGYVCRGYRMFEKSIYGCTWDLLGKVPSLKNPDRTLKEDFFDFNKKIAVDAKARLVEKGKVIDARRMELSWRDRFKMTRLLYWPESYFKDRKIGDFFTPQFFKTNFWFEWATSFAFQPWHSLVEMKRYLESAVHVAYRMNNLSCVLSAPFCEHDFFVLPIVNFLKELGVNFEQNCTVKDLEFDQKKGEKRVTAIILEKGEQTSPQKMKVRADDLVFITNGSMTADASIGSMETAPAPFAEKSGAWDLWKNIAERAAASNQAKKLSLAGKNDPAGENTWAGNPEVFCSNPEKSSWESFTITFRDPLFFNLVEGLTGNKAGTGGLTTIKDSNWMLTLGLPPQPYFIGQPEDVFVCWGYGLMPNKTGNFVKKKMNECSGKEILEELCLHFGFKKDLPAIMESATCIPALMPYITSQFMPRHKADRPEVVPAGVKNFAFIGQYAEMPGNVVFTVEAAIRTAKLAVARLVGLPERIPRFRSGKYGLISMFKAFRTIL